MSLDPGSLGWWYYPLSLLTNVFDSFLPPLPQELFVLAIGPLVSAGKLALWPAVAVAWVGNVLGDVLLAWAVATRTAWLERSRWGRWLLAKASAGRRTLGERGSFGVLVGLRFVSGGRTASYVAAGLAQVPRGVVWASSVLGSAAWVAFMVLLGQWTQRTTGLSAWASALLGMGLGTLIGLIPASIAWVRHRWGPERRRGTDGRRGSQE